MEMVYHLVMVGLSLMMWWLIKASIARKDDVPAWAPIVAVVLTSITVAFW